MHQIPFIKYNYLEDFLNEKIKEGKDGKETINSILFNITHKFLDQSDKVIFITAGDSYRIMEG